MTEVVQTEEFSGWLKALRDGMARAKIAALITKMGRGLVGDVKPVGEGVSESRLNHGPGYRVYFISRGEELIVLLAGGDKSTQDTDIVKAKQLAKQL